MSLMEINGIKPLNTCPLTKPSDLYIGDLLSCVMAHIEEGSLWLTTQTNLNVIAIAHLHDLAGIIFVEDMLPDQATIEKADECGIALFSYAGSAYPLVKEIEKIGLAYVL